MMCCLWLFIWRDASGKTVHLSEFWVVTVLFAVFKASVVLVAKTMICSKVSSELEQNLVVFATEFSINVYFNCRLLICRASIGDSIK